MGEVAHVIAGQHIEASLYNGNALGTPYLTGPADFGDVNPKITKWTLVPKVLASSGDVLVTVKGAGVGKSNLGCDAAIGRQLMALRPIEGKVTQPYLFHFIRFQEEMIARLADGATVPGLGKDDLATLRLPAISLDEQRRIAAILDEADALRRKRGRTIEVLDGLRQSVFLEMFGNPETNPKRWRWGRIGDLLQEVQYGTSAKAGDTGEYPILRMGNITTEGRMEFDDLKYIDLAEKDVSKFTVRRGDILFNRTNSADLVGKTAVFDRDDPFAFAGYLVRARVQESVSPYYVSGYLNSAHGKATLRSMAKSIIGMANINAKEMQSIPILLPDAQTQSAYSGVLSVIEKCRSECCGHLTSLNVFFSSLQHRAFSGQL